jgi:hypothetical protein
MPFVFYIGADSLRCSLDLPGPKLLTTSDLRSRRPSA